MTAARESGHLVESKETREIALTLFSYDFGAQRSRAQLPYIADIPFVVEGNFCIDRGPLALSFAAE